MKKSMLYVLMAAALISAIIGGSVGLTCEVIQQPGC